ncbi:hypothetical protein N431DRAFT_541303 [Stipitochalara longipes BDJ]|nr:hypothetical protein N431DRAFT_541303 [Stipitochalara longipes BDJ]
MDTPASLARPEAVRILSFDGGGVKGLASLLILQRIFRTLQRLENLPDLPRPCDYFDLIGGTSTGGLIAIMLGRLRMTIPECIEIFKHISKSVFGDNPGMFRRVAKQMAGKPFFNAQALEKAIKELLTARGIDPDALFKESDDPKCKVFVCCTRNIKLSLHNVLFRSYTTWYPSEENYICHIWEAARATSAAPLFFAPLKLKSSGATFGDGALGLNNPINEVLNEARRLYKNTPIRSLLSIGTGLTDVKGLDTGQINILDVLKTCVDLSMNANKQAEDFAKSDKGREMFDNRTYFRFDVDRNIETISLEEWKKLDEIDGLTEAYLGRPEKEKDLLDCARSLCDRIASVNTAEVGPKTPVLKSTLPVYSTPNFSGREGELSELESIFKNSDEFHKRVALYGLGGIGKSQIAYEYAKRHSGEQTTFWVRANNLDNMKIGYLAIASLLKLDLEQPEPDVLLIVKNNLESQDSLPWLLVLDDIDDKETMFTVSANGVKLMDYIPRSKYGRVLITTRDSRVVGLLDGFVVPAQNGIRVGPMPFDEALSLFQRCLRRELIQEATQEQCQAFLDMLGGLPLALVQAASYMREEEAPIHEFISLYRDVEKHEELFQESAINTDMEQRSVLYTWEISYKRIAGPSYPTAKSQAAMLLDLLGFLDAQASSTRSLSEVEARLKGTYAFEAIEGFKHALPPQESPSTLLSSINESRFKNVNRFYSTIGRLRNYSLVTSADCWVHPVVHSWIYRRLSLEERCKYFSWMVEELLKHLSSPDLQSWEVIILPIDSAFFFKFKDMHYLRHANVVLGYALSARMVDYIMEHRIGTADLEELLYRIGEVSASSGQTAKAIEYLEKSISLMGNSASSEVLLNERRLRLAKIRSQVQSAEESTNQARLCIQAAPSDFESQLWLARCLRKQGNFEQALASYREIISLPTLDYQDFERNKSLLVALCEVASLCSRVGTEECITYARDIIDNLAMPFIQAKPRGDIVKAFLYRKLLITRLEVASDLKDQENVCQLMVEYDAYHERLGPPLTGGVPEELLSHLDQLQERRKWPEIEVLVRIYSKPRWDLLKIMLLKVSHPEHSDLINDTVLHWCIIYNIQGEAYFEEGKFREAEAAHMNALGLHLFLHSSGSDSHEFKDNLYNLARSLAVQGDSKEAELRIIQQSFHNILAEMEAI